MALQEKLNLGKPFDSRSQTSSMFSRTEEPNWTEQGEAFWYPGPDHSHFGPCHNTGAKGAEVHHLHQLSERTKGNRRNMSEY